MAATSTWTSTSCSSRTRARRGCARCGCERPAGRLHRHEATNGTNPAGDGIQPERAFGFSALISIPYFLAADLIRRQAALRSA
jgi:hypothetical protein